MFLVEGKKSNYHGTDVKVIIRKVHNSKVVLTVDLLSSELISVSPSWSPRWGGCRSPAALQAPLMPVNRAENEKACSFAHNTPPNSLIIKFNRWCL